MAKRARSKEPEADAPVGWAEFLSFVSLFVAVVGVLGLGAILKTNPPPSRPAVISDSGAGSIASRETRRDATVTPTRPPVEPVTTPELQDSRPAPVPVPDPTIAPKSDLARRAEADLRRAGQAGPAWTLQLALLCDPSGARDAIDLFGSHRALHLLPTLHKDRACFKLCWNRYATSHAAKAARDLPPAIRSRFSSGFPTPIAEAIR